MAVRVTFVVFCCYCCYDVDVNACGTLPLLPVSCPTKQKNDNIALLPVPPDQLERRNKSTRICANNKMHLFRFQNVFVKHCNTFSPPPDKWERRNKYTRILILGKTNKVWENQKDLVTKMIAKCLLSLWQNWWFKMTYEISLDGNNCLMIEVLVDLDPKK